VENTLLLRLPSKTQNGENVGVATIASGIRKILGSYTAV
jgi:hypothetical protein